MHKFTFYVSFMQSENNLQVIILRTRDVCKKHGQALRFKRHFNMLTKSLKFMRFTILKENLKFLWTIKNLDQLTTSKNIRESKFRKRRPSFNLRFKLTKDENCEMVIFQFYYVISPRHYGVP